LPQEAKEHIDALVGGTFFMLNAEGARALFEKLSASERKSEEHGLKENSRTIEIDPLTRKFQGMALSQPAVSGTHQAEQKNPSTAIRQEEKAHVLDQQRCYPQQASE
jgi:hypothetical protein